MMRALVASAAAILLAGCGPSVSDCSPESDAELCAKFSAECGVVSTVDRCGDARDVASCGTCPESQICGGGGPANVCGVRQVVCSKDDWCWQSPLPAASPMRALFGTSDHDVWTVGPAGVIQHWNATLWARTPSGTDLALWGGWASGPNDAWAVGALGALAHWDGRNWTATTGTVTNVDLRAMYGFAANDLWAVGGSNQASAHAVAAHYDGTNWTASPSLPVGALNAVWGASSNDIWAAGAYGERPLLVHWNGSAWQEVTTAPKTLAEVTAIGGAGGRLWVVGRLVSQKGALFVYNGTNWTQAPNDTLLPLFAVRVFSESDVWVAGAKGTVLHWDGKSWAAPVTIANGTLRALWGSSSSDLWAGGDSGIVYHFDGTSWKPASAPTAEDLKGIWASDASAAWAVGTRAALIKYDGAGWTRVGGVQDDESESKRDDLNAIAGLGASQLWAVGQDTLLASFDDAGWKVTPPPEFDTLNAVWPVSATSVWAAGGRASVPSVLLLHYTGVEWVKQEVTASEIRGVWGCTDDDLWLVTVGGAILHWDKLNSVFVAVEGPKDDAGTAIALGDLNAIVGFGCEDTSKPQSIWAVGSVGTTTREAAVIQWDGTRWSLAKPGVNAELKAIAGTSPTDLWAVGAGGAVVHWDGTAWAAQESGAAVSLNAVRATAGGVWAVGDAGTILFRAAK